VVKPNRIDSGFGVTRVLKHLFGNGLLIKDTVNNIGLSFGLPKATRLGNYVTSRVTAKPSLNESRITGFTKRLTKILTILNINIFSSTALTFTRMDALSL